MSQVLPPGPRDYWKELAAEHKQVPEHQKWMYDADPFGAKKMVEERQAKASQRRDESTSGSSDAKPNHHLSTGSRSTDYPEVVMASSLRELVEDAIKKVNKFSVFTECFN